MSRHWIVQKGRGWNSFIVFSAIALEILGTFGVKCLRICAERDRSPSSMPLT